MITFKKDELLRKMYHGPIVQWLRPLVYTEKTAVRFCLGPFESNQSSRPFVDTRTPAEVLLRTI